MALHFIDPAGRVYMSEGTTTLNEVLNGDTTLEVKMPYTETTSSFVLLISQGWQVSGVNGDDNTKYTIKYISKTVIGKRPYLEITAIPHFQHVFSTRRLYTAYYENEYSVHTVLNAIFTNSGYTYRIADTLPSVTEVYMDEFGDGQSFLEIFQNVLQMWGLEFIINGTQVDLYKYIKRVPKYYVSDQINARNVKLEEDGTGFYTYGRAYYDINDGETLESSGGMVEYQHPLYSVLGRQDAPPMRINNSEEDINVSNIQQALKEFIDNSLKLTVTADFVTLREEWPEAVARLADEVEFIAENIDFKTKLRLVSISTKRNHFGDIIEQSVTFGDLPIGERHQANLNYAAQFVHDLEQGRKALPLSTLDAAAQMATQLLLNANTQLDFTKTQGIIAKDAANPNYLVMYNSKGLGISDDGGLTFRNAITGAGIVADVITAGVLNTSNVIITGESGNLMLTGDRFTSIDPLNVNKKVEITPGKIEVQGGGITVYRPDGKSAISNGLLDTEYNVWPYQPPFMTQRGGLSVFFETGPFYTITKEESEAVGDYAVINAFRFKHTARYLIIGVAVSNAKVGGFVRFEEFGTYATPFTTSTTGFTTTATPTVDLKIDLGPPTKKERKFYWMAKTNTQGTDVNEFGVRCYKMALDD